jgi:hypothetical protein
MNDPLDSLEAVLVKSVAKNGDKPVTLSHLLNLVRCAIRARDIDEEAADLEGMGHDD